MSKVNDEKLWRIVDANLNRGKEGLRVCEDVCRFILDDTVLTREFKNIRHRVTRILPEKILRRALAARKIEADVGRGSTFTEGERDDFRGIFAANIQRVKESVRVLEECMKVVDRKSFRDYKNLRYRIYELEQKSLQRL